MIQADSIASPRHTAFTAKAPRTPRKAIEGLASWRVGRPEAHRPAFAAGAASAE